MSSLFKVRKNYKIVYSDSDKKPKQKAIYIKAELGKRIAERLKVKLDKLYELGEFDPWVHDHKNILNAATARKFGDVIKEYLEYKSKRDWGETTSINYRYSFQKIIKNLDNEYAWMSSINSQTLNAYINRKENISYATRKGDLRKLKAFVKWSNDSGYSDIDSNGLKVFSVNKGYKNEINYFEPEEIKYLIKYIERKVKSDIRLGYQKEDRNSLWLCDFIMWQVSTGMRLRETINLLVKDVDLKKGVVKIYNQKAKRIERIDISNNKKVFEIARKYVELNDLVSERRLFQHVDAKRVSRNFKKYLKLAIPEKADHCQHDLRHTCCVWLIRENMNLVKVKEYMRHSKLSTTMGYANLAGKDYFDEASEIMNCVFN